VNQHTIGLGSRVRSARELNSRALPFSGDREWLERGPAVSERNRRSDRRNSDCGATRTGAPFGVVPMLVRFLQPLPVSITSRRGTVCTLALQVEPSSERREIVMHEAGRCGYWALHTFNCWERDRIGDMLHRDGVPVRPGGMFERCARAMAGQGMAEIVAGPDLGT
jgi:hypothetical protein